MPDLVLGRQHAVGVEPAGVRALHHLADVEVLRADEPGRGDVGVPARVRARHGCQR